jgi:hypothetical protein
MEPRQLVDGLDTSHIHKMLDSGSLLPATPSQQASNPVSVIRIIVNTLLAEIRETDYPTPLCPFTSEQLKLLLFFIDVAENGPDIQYKLQIDILEKRIGETAKQIDHLN